METDFITHPPEADKGYNAITTHVHRFTKRVHFIPSRLNDVVGKLTSSFYKHLFYSSTIICLEESGRDRKVISAFKKSLTGLWTN